ncbi:PadR family transcriptional regulator [Botrimarina colliarenosi]|nr:PadR family transcriptional regulator [Botrimarina colliarenosi]
MSTRRTNPDFLNGVPELVVLELLSRRAMYGYEIVQAIQEQSGGVLGFGEGCVYPLLHKLEERGQLASQRVAFGGRSRVVYRVTTPGKSRLAETATEWRRIAASIQGILQGGDHALVPVHERKAG